MFIPQQIFKLVTLMLHVNNVEFMNISFVFQHHWSSSLNVYIVQLHDCHFLKKIIYLFLFLAALGLRCCAWAFFSCGEWGLLFVVVHRLLIEVASLAAEHRLQACGLSSCGSQALEHRLSSCGTRAQLLHSMWDLPALGLEPVSSALAGGFLTPVPPGKPCQAFLKSWGIRHNFS